MKLTIFGATGRTGRLLLRQALEQGHYVTVLVRSPEKIGLDHANLFVLRGDVLDGERVRVAVAEADVVISVLGPVRGGPPDLMTRAAGNIVAAMEKHRVRRLIFATGAGVRAPEDQPGFVDKLFGALLRTMARTAYLDSARAAGIVRMSRLDWTITRCPRLVDGDFTGYYQVGFLGGEMTSTLLRGNFAHFILKQVEDDAYVGKMPAAAEKKS